VLRDTEKSRDAIFLTQSGFSQYRATPSVARIEDDTRGHLVANSLLLGVTAVCS
jgi:hypothetical protein